MPKVTKKDTPKYMDRYRALESKLKKINDDNHTMFDTKWLLSIAYKDDMAEFRELCATSNNPTQKSLLNKLDALHKLLSEKNTTPFLFITNKSYTHDRRTLIDSLFQLSNVKNYLHPRANVDLATQDKAISFAVTAALYIAMNTLELDSRVTIKPPAKRPRKG